MVPGPAAARRAGIEQLLASSRVGEADLEGSGACEGEVEILLVQLDAEPGIEVPLDHALAMNFKDTRGSKAAHQGLPHLRRVGPAFEAKSNASPTASMVSATMIWFPTLHVWPSPFPPTSV